MINFDLKIERISNGYIVLNEDAGDGDATEKRYYLSMEELYGAKLHETMKEIDENFRNGRYGPGGQIRFRVSLNHSNEIPYPEQIDK